MYPTFGRKLQVTSGTYLLTRSHSIACIIIIIGLFSIAAKKLDYASTTRMDTHAETEIRRYKLKTDIFCQEPVQLSWANITCDLWPEIFY